MHVISVFLVIVGLIALVLSLIPLTEICLHETRSRLGWRAMFVLVLIFILGYSFFCYHLMFKIFTVIDLILASIFAGGGLFVVLVSRMSLASLNELQVTALEFKKQSLHDILTGLPNRKKLMLTLETTIAASGREDANFSVIVMDLNGFKKINDTLGHQAGDLALQIIAPRLGQQLRASDTLCRLGGDEFAVILPQTNKEDAIRVAKKMLLACAESLVVENNKIVLGISIGISLSPNHASDANTLLRCADIAMYQAKQQKTGVEVYSKDIDRSSVELLSDVPDILQAMKENKLEIYFQPVLGTNVLKGLEVSLRWCKEDGSVVTARNFMKSLVDLGASWPLIELVIDEAFINHSRWMKQFNVDIELRINLFLGGVDKDEFCEFILSKAQQHEISTNNIKIEVVESLLGRETVIDLMESLHDKGLKIAIDDFGSGGARLIALKNVVLDEVKLDKSITKNLMNRSADIILINTIKSFCDQMDISFVVPYVNDKSTLSMLKDIGVDQYQGDVLCPFISVGEMNEWLVSYYEKPFNK